MQFLRFFLITFGVSICKVRVVARGCNLHASLSEPFSGSACTSESLEPSYVLRSLGVGEETAHTSLRIGIGGTPPARLTCCDGACSFLCRNVALFRSVVSFDVQVDLPGGKRWSIV